MLRSLAPALTIALALVAAPAFAQSAGGSGAGGSGGNSGGNVPAGPSAQAPQMAMPTHPTAHPKEPVQSAGRRARTHAHHVASRRGQAANEDTAAGDAAVARLNEESLQAAQSGQNFSPSR